MINKKEMKNEKTRDLYEEYCNDILNIENDVNEIINFERI